MFSQDEGFPIANILFYVSDGPPVEEIEDLDSFVSGRAGGLKKRRDSGIQVA